MSLHSPDASNLYEASFNPPSCPCRLVASRKERLRLNYCFPGDWLVVAAVEQETFQSVQRAQYPELVVCVWEGDLEKMDNKRWGTAQG